MMPAKTQRAIQESLGRLLSTNGELERSTGRPLFKDITDGLLIEIWQAVRDQGDAVQPKISGLAQKRLMLRVVIDALRSPVVLDDAAALKAGDRIWKQAQRVSDAITSTAVEHASQRDAARAAAAADPNLAAGLAMELGAISAAEDTRCDKLRREVYTGLDVSSRSRLFLTPLLSQPRLSIRPNLITPRISYPRAPACATHT